jgi:hypothetical protein
MPSVRFPEGRRIGDDATVAMEAGQLFYEVQLEVGAHVGSAGFGRIESRRTTSSSAVTLGEIEKLG